MHVFPAAMLAGVGLIVTTAGASQTPNAPAPVRVIEGNSVISSALPRLRVDVKAPFRYLGRVPIRIRDVAAGERIVFGDVDGKRIRRMVVLQFEGFLPHTTDIYRYDFSKAREIAGHRWRANAFGYMVPSGDDARSPEASTMHRWLREQGYATDETQLMFRLLTIGDDRRRDELIVFYLEGSNDASWLREMEAQTLRWQSLAARLEKDAMAALSIK